MSDPSGGRPSDAAAGSSDAGALSDQILAAEAERQAELAAEPVILDDDQLPGVGANGAARPP